MRSDLGMAARCGSRSAKGLGVKVLNPALAEAFELLREE
jgi:hypothetical protein